MLEPDSEFGSAGSSSIWCDITLENPLTEKPISRQRAYQIAKIAEGLCGRCGRRKLWTKHYCKTCAGKVRKYAKEKAEARRRAAGLPEREPGAGRKKKGKS
jgi:hypothetical protein